MASGVAAGLVLDRVGGRRRWWAGATVAIVLIAACAPSLRSVLVPQFADAWRHPDRYFWRTEEWACNGVTRAVCDPLDAAAALTLRTLTAKDDRILTNVGRKEFLVHPIVSALAGAPVTGHGLRLSSSRTVSMGTGYREPLGFQAIAFWHTGEASLLARMSVTWLLLDPTRMAPATYQHLLQQGRLQLVDRQEDARRAERREVYRVTSVVQNELASPLPRLVLTGVALPSPLWPARFYAIPFAVTSLTDDRLDGVLDVGGRIVRNGVVVNANDEVRRLVRLESSGPRQWRGTLWMVTPYETGEYELAPDVTDGQTRIPLVDPAGAPQRLRLRVSPPEPSAW
jgi:hypothetical protein